MHRSLFGSLLLLSACKNPVVLESYLSVLHVSPGSGVGEVGIDTDVTVGFSEPLVATSLTPYTLFLEDPDGEPMLGVMAYDDNHWSVSLTPDGDLEPATTYTIVITNRVEGEESGDLAQEIRSSFTTAELDASANAVPVAIAGDNRVSAAGTTLGFDGSASVDPEGEPLLYAWNLEALPVDSEAALIDADTVNPSLNIDVPGTYVASLRVSDGLNWSDAAYTRVRAD